MEQNQNLYKQLDELRNHLKEKALASKKVFNCSDSVLNQIANLCPRKLSDFESISGVGPAFIENYAPYFIQIIKNYTENPDDTIKLNKKGITILQDYEKKLINLSKKNHLLYCPKLHNNFGVDLANSTNDIRNIILGTGRTATVAKAEDPSYKTIISLLRSNNRNLREKGQNNLFIAYPFVKGKFTEEDFTIRAPLALFPIKGERSTTGVKLTLDREREVLFNTTLILANYKFKNINTPLPQDTIEDTSKEGFINSLLRYYKENKFTINTLHPSEDDNTILPFQNYTTHTLPKFNKGEFWLEKNAVLGIFPITSSSIQKDFQQIVESKKINKLLNDLLENKDYEDFEWEKPKDISEKEVNYINNLDAAQENVIAAMQTTDELVIQGPPGTGKSQTITNLIADYALKGKSILLVSEKKTALDVVYSRLGSLSKFAMLLDDVNNKTDFYSQLSVMINNPMYEPENNYNLEEIETEIDNNFDSYKNIEKVLYTKDSFNIEPYKLYLINDSQEIIKKETLKKNRKISALLGKSWENFTYDEVVNSQTFYTNEENLNNTTEFLSADRKYPWLQDTKQNLTDYEIQDSLLDIENILAIKEKQNQKNILQKIFTRNSVKVELKNFFSKFFANPQNQNSKKQKIIKLLYRNLELIESSFEQYEQYWNLNEKYQQLPASTQNFYSLMEKIQPESQNLKNAISDLTNFIFAQRLINFETSHRDLLNTLQNSHKLIENISRNMELKREINRHKLESLLTQNLLMLTQSKRRSEIAKAVESKRKWTVNRFVNKFNFELFHSIKIWLLTPEVVSEIIPIETNFFDLVIFDEASQMFVEKGLPSILRGKQVVIAGDQKQLRPSNLFSGRFQLDEDQIPEEDIGDETSLSIATEEDSLLDLARFKYNSIMLNYHYRSAYEELIAYSNYAFYEGKLYVSPNTTKPELPPIQVHKIENAVWSNRSNQKEAEFIVKLVKDFFATRKHNETIGIITFNTNQRDLIDDLLDKECEKDNYFAQIYISELNRKKDGQDIGLFVKNIETVQGDERDVILFSIGYAKNTEGKLIQNFGWLNQSGGENRLNVAVSRAKKKIHIVVSFDPTELKMDSTKNNGPQALKNYLVYAMAVSTGNKNKQTFILENLNYKNQQAESQESTQNTTELLVIDQNYQQKTTPEQVFQKKQYKLQLEIENFLSDHGYAFDRNVGIGNYTIDYAILDSNQYVLGIQWDSHLYEQAAPARERDYYRQKYLESRGWNIYRLNTILWQKNPEKSKAQLLKKIEENIKD